MTGKDIIIVLSQGGTALAASLGVKSHDINTTADTIEKASATQQSWREYLAGRKAWSVNMSYLVTAGAKIVWELKVGQTFTVTISDSNSNYRLTGSAILETAKQTYTVGNLANGSFILKGTGPLTT